MTLTKKEHKGKTNENQAKWAEQMSDYRKIKYN